MTRAEYIEKTLAVMNEVAYDATQSLLAADQSKVDTFIAKAWRDAWCRLVSIYPKQLFVTRSFKDNALVCDLSCGTGTVELPADFYVLSRFKMRGWQRAVTVANYETEEDVKRQSNEYTRGSVTRPVCLIRKAATGNDLVLAYYSLRRGLTHHAIEEALYIPFAEKIDTKADDYELGIDNKLEIPLAYMAASTVFTLFEKRDVAAELLQVMGQMRIAV